MNMNTQALSVQPSVPPIARPAATAVAPPPPTTTPAVVQTPQPRDALFAEPQGSAAGVVEFVPRPGQAQKLLAAAQTTLQASTSNGMLANLGAPAAGAAVGALMARTLGGKMAPLAILGASVGSLANRGVGIARQQAQIQQAYASGKSEASLVESALQATSFALEIATLASAKKLIQAAAIPRHSPSQAPVSEGFRQYKADENQVGQQGKAWEFSETRGIPSPKQLAALKGRATVTGAEAFLDPAQNRKLAGARIEDIVARIPKEARLRELTPSPTIKEGFEYAWVDKKTNMDFRVRVHGADAGVAARTPQSTAAQGWIVRVERNPVGQRTFEQTEYLTLDGSYHKGSELKQLEARKLALETALGRAPIGSAQAQSVGQVSVAAHSSAIGQAPLNLSSPSAAEKLLKTVGAQIEHFHHSTHLALGGFNQALKP